MHQLKKTTLEKLVQATLENLVQKATLENLVQKATLEKLIQKPTKGPRSKISFRLTLRPVMRCISCDESTNFNGPSAKSRAWRPNRSPAVDFGARLNGGDQPCARESTYCENLLRNKAVLHRYSRLRVEASVSLNGVFFVSRDLYSVSSSFLRKPGC